MLIVDPVYWKNRRWRESKPGIFTLRATEPSCCIRKIKHDWYSLAGKGRPCLIFISAQKFCSVIVSHFILFGFLLGSLTEKLFQGSRSNYSVPAKDISRSRWTRKKNSMSVIFRTDIIMGALITETVINTKTKKNLEPDSTLSKLHAPPCQTRCFAPAKICLPW